MKILLLSITLIFSLTCYAEQSTPPATQTSPELSQATKLPFHHTNSKGAVYYLFSKDISLKNSDKTRTIYYFSKDPKNSKGTPLFAVPDNKQVSETSRGLLVLKNK